MASSGMSGPFTLSPRGIDQTVEAGRIGTYALGNTGNDGTFFIGYVGRSDIDLNGRLKQHVGKHPLFKALYWSTAKEAFEHECRVYHDFSPPENEIHPDRKKGTAWSCPACPVFD